MSISRFNIKKDPRTIVLFAAMLCWMSIIFYFSAQPGDISSSTSGAVMEVIKAFFNFLYKGSPPAFIRDHIIGNGHLLRKTGHAFEYAVLGGLVISFIKRVVARRFFLVSALICLLYAVSDELHQFFVPGRSCQFTDILLDFIAATAGIALMLFICGKSIPLKS